MPSPDPHDQTRIHNALLRCTRRDTKAHPLFECVRQDLGLWVWELSGYGSCPWNQWTRETADALRAQLAKLSTLKYGSTDYTLFIEVGPVSDLKPLRIPSELTEISSVAGFSIELLMSRDQPDD